MDQDISLRKLSVSDADELYCLTDLNREHLREWLPWLDTNNSPNDTKRFIESISDGSPTYAVVNQDKICGVVGFHKIDSRNNAASIGYWLDKHHIGKGIMTVAVKKILNIGFGEFNLNKIEVHCAPENLNSCAIPLRLGFTYEATLRQCEWLYTKYVDHAIYSLLASEHNA